MRECTLFSADRRTSQLVAAAGAALGLEISSEVELPRHFPEQGLLLIGMDLAPISIPSRLGVLLLDLDTPVAASSGALVGMAGSDQDVVGQLASRLGKILQDEPTCRLISIVPVAGGLGLTTLIALLGLVSVGTNNSTLLIDQSEQLHRVLGAKALSVDHELQPSAQHKVGVLNSDVIVTPALIFDLRSRFDSVIYGDGLRSAKTERPVDLLLLVANTALAVERSAALLADVNYDSVQVILRRLTYGSLSTHQVAAALRTRIVEWPTDPNLALAADFGDLSQAKAAIKWANQLWLNSIGTRRAN